MITRESIIDAFKKNFVDMFCGEERVSLHPHLCENYYMDYEMHDGELYCYELEDGIKTGARAEDLTNRKLYVFIDELMSMLETRARREYHSGIARQLRNLREDIRKALLN